MRQQSARRINQTLQELVARYRKASIMKPEDETPASESSRMTRF
jgi:hypothetical protein